MAKKDDKRVKYASDTEKPVMLSLRLPRELYDRLERYASEHRQNVSELVRDGIEMRLEVEADPRSRSTESTTEETEFQIDGASILRDMQATLARHETQMEALMQAIERQTAAGSTGPYDGVPYPVIHSNTAREPEGPVSAAAPVSGGNDGQIETITASPENNYYEQIQTVPIVTGTSAEQRYTVPTPAENVSRQIEIVPDQSDSIPAYDHSKHHLGKLCPRGHDWHGTRQSLLRNANDGCLECDRERARERRQQKRQTEAATP